MSNFDKADRTVLASLLFQWIQLDCSTCPFAEECLAFDKLHNRNLCESAEDLYEVVK